MKNVNTWKAVTGVLLLAIGLEAFWQSYTTADQCNSILGRISIFVTSIFGGSGAQACYNAQLGQVGGVLVALIGLVVLYQVVTGKKG